MAFTIWRPARPLLLVALVSALLLHGGLGRVGTYAQTYDAYIHMFFADHWVRSWFDHWERIALVHRLWV